VLLFYICFKDNLDLLPGTAFREVEGTTATPFKETSRFVTSHRSVTTHDTSHSLCHSSSDDDDPGQQRTTSPSSLLAVSIELTVAAAACLACSLYLASTFFSSRAHAPHSSLLRRGGGRIARHEGNCRRPPRMRSWATNAPARNATQ
jgi:hypothetical protein